MDGPVTGLESEIAKETTIEEAPAAAAMPPMSEQLSIPLEKIIPQEQIPAVEAVQAVIEEPQEQTIRDAQIHPVQPATQQQAYEEEQYQAPQMPDAEAIALEEARLQAKEEARKLLTQPVVQISAEQRKTVSQINRESREKRVIHPIDVQKRYNNKSAVTGDGADASGDSRQAKGDVAVKSSLKKILDESEPHK